MRTQFRSASPELYLAGAVVVSLGLAGILSLIPRFSFGSFTTMAGILIAADLVIYLLMKVGAVKAPKDRMT